MRPLADIAVTFLLLSSLSALAAARTHYYGLNGSYADEMGGHPLSPNGGFLGPTGYFFPTDGGPTLPNSVDPSDYSIEMVFSFKDTDGYRKIVDFKDRSSDTGLYNLSGAFTFFPVVRGTNVVFTNDVLVHLVLTRDGASGQVSGFVNGDLQWSFVDGGSIGVISAVAGAIHLFRDDLATGKSEATGGFLDRLQVFKGALTSVEARWLFEWRAPVLRITPSLPILKLEWTNIVPFYRLERSDALGSLAVWLQVTNEVTTNALLHGVSLESEPTGAQFFRLRRWR